MGFRIGKITLLVYVIKYCFGSYFNFKGHVGFVTLANCVRCKKCFNFFVCLTPIYIYVARVWVDFKFKVLKFEFQPQIPLFSLPLLPPVPIASTRWHCVGAKGSREAAKFPLAFNWWCVDCRAVSWRFRVSVVFRCDWKSMERVVIQCLSLSDNFLCVCCCCFVLFCCTAPERLTKRRRTRR